MESSRLPGGALVDAPPRSVHDDAPAHSYRWVILVVLWVTFIVVFLSRLSIGPLAPFLRDSLQISAAQVGLVLSAAALGYALAQLPIGVYADRMGARWPMVWGELIAGVAMLGIFLMPTYQSLLILMFVAGAGCGFLAPSTTRAVVIWFPKRERATVMGLKQTAVNFGGMIGAATLPAVALWFGWRYGFLYLAAAAIGAALLSLVFYREPAGMSVPGRLQSPDAVSLRDVLRNRNLWLVGMGGFCLNWIELSMIAHVVVYLGQLEFSVIAAGGLLAMSEGAGALTRPISGWVSDRLFGGRRNPVFMLFCAVSAAMCLVLALAGPLLGVILYPVLFLLGIGSIGWGGVFLTLLSEFGGSKGAAKAAALGSMISMGGSIMGPPAFGYLLDRTESYQLAWLSLAVIGIVAVALLSLVRESERRI